MIVMREGGHPTLWDLSTLEAAAWLALDLASTADDDKEHVRVILLYAKQRYRMHSEVAIGTQDAALVHPCEGFGAALREGAAEILVVHNHPSRDPTLSLEDWSLTARFTQVEALLGVALLDHVIVGNGIGRCFSLSYVAQQ